MYRKKGKVKYITQFKYFKTFILVHVDTKTINVNTGLKLFMRIQTASNSTYLAGNIKAYTELKELVSCPAMLLHVVDNLTLSEECPAYVERKH